MRIETEKDREFRYQLGLQLAKRDVERFLATGTIENKEHSVSVQINAAEKEHEYSKLRQDVKQTVER